MPERRRITIMEAVEADPGSYNTLMMAQGQPGIPMRFRWRGQAHEIAEILETTRETERSSEYGGSEEYVRRHVVRVRTQDGQIMCLTGSRGTRARAPRWTIRYLEPDEADAT